MSGLITAINKSVPVALLGVIICLCSIALYSNIETTVCCLLFLIGFSQFSKLFLDSLLFKVYTLDLLLLLLYVTSCFIYMKVHDYDYLLTYDTIHVFLPNTEEYINGNSYNEALALIWEDYNIFNRLQVGFYSVLALLASFAHLMNAETYLVIQIGLISLCAYIPVIVCNFFSNIVKLDRSHSAIYAIVIASCSSILFYSSTILRDGLVMLIILHCIYLMMRPYSVKRNLIIFGLIILLTTFRIETGIMMLIYLPFYFLYISKRKSIWMILECFVFLSLVLFIMLVNRDSLLMIFENNYEAYSSGVDEQSGIIGTLQKLPFGVSQLLSVIYTSLTPVPCWVKMSAYFDPSRPECYNLMLFPTAISSFFNLFIITTLISGLFSKHKIAQEIYPIKVYLIPTLICLGLQSAVVEQRRVLALYTIVYILAFCYYYNFRNRNKNGVLIITSVIFIFLNIFGAIMLI